MENQTLRDRGITLQTLAEKLAEKSADICSANNCTVDEHRCESYAYISADGDLLDVCLSDYFQGYRGAYVAIALPWTGDGVELADAVDRGVEEAC